MNRKQFRALIALNAALLVVLAAVTLSPAASAQRAPRARGEYTMISGAVQGRQEAAIYLIDASNQELVAFRWENSRRSLQPLGYRNLREDAAGPTGAGR